MKFNLNNYISPKNERSYYKGIPVEFRSKVRAILKSKGYKGSEIRFEYRGSRRYNFYGKCEPSCRLRNAKTFAVYRRII
jgi:hypothetical protein